MKMMKLKTIFIWIVCTIMMVSLAIGPGVAPVAPQQSYIVQGQSTEQVVSVVEKYGGTVTSRLDIIKGAGALLTDHAADLVRVEPGIKSITLNAAVKMVKDNGDEWDEEGGTSKISPSTDYPDVTGADLAWEENVTGKDVSVAILDTGISRHRGLVRGLNNRKDRIIAWKDFISNSRKPIDPNGHGTHVAGIIANSQKGTDQEWNGMAPGVKLVGVRVLDETGAGTYESVIQGIQWVIEKKDRYNIKVINLSLVAAVQSPYFADPLNQAVMTAWGEGITVVVAAGNGGPSAMSLSVPGNNPYVITVGAFTDNFTPDDWSDDYIASFSAAGPTLDGFVKPDVVAPGAHMVSTMMPNSYIAKNHQANRVANQYFSMAGTSQAAASVSGVVALMLSYNPDLIPEQVKYRLMNSAMPWVSPDTGEAVYSIWQQGAGRVNAYDAIFAEFDGYANEGMDIWADLDGTEHYQGLSYFDSESGQYRLGGDFEVLEGYYSHWDGAYGPWTGAYNVWDSKVGAWSGKVGAWSGKVGAWSGSFDETWAGKVGAWSGKVGAWSGGFATWSGGYGAWTGSEPWAAQCDATFTENYVNAVPASIASALQVSNWVEEP